MPALKRCGVADFQEGEAMGRLSKFMTGAAKSLVFVALCAFGSGKP